MKIRPLRVTNQPKLMIIPMIDIIFFLLVFFMMSMLTMIVQKTITINLPQATTSSVNLDKTLPISVTKDGQVYVEKELIGMDLLQKRLEIAKKNNEDVAVVLRGDNNVDYGKMIGVLDIIKATGIKRVAIATEGK